MTSDEWYRSADWDADAQALFREKLSRARNQRGFYRRVKADAIADRHPQDALALHEEALSEADGDTAGIHYAMAMIHWKMGNEDSFFHFLDLALGSNGMALGASGVMENAFASGLLRRTERYERALELFEPWDKGARQAYGRPFSRSFAGAFGSAIILHHFRRHEEAREMALTAIEWTEKKSGPIPSNPDIGLPPQVPDDWKELMLAIASKA